MQLQYTYNLGQIEGLCLRLIEPNECLQEGDGYRPVPQSPTTVRCSSDLSQKISVFIYDRISQ